MDEGRGQYNKGYSDKYIFFESDGGTFSIKLDDYIRTTIVCKSYGKNCVNSEKAVTASETLTEYTIRSCTTITSNNCRPHWRGLYQKCDPCETSMSSYSTKNLRMAAPTTINPPHKYFHKLFNRISGICLQ